MSRFPALNPLIAAPSICSQCGEEMKMEIKRGPMNRVEKIIYRCENPETGCNYQVESDQRLNGMTLPVSKDANR